MSAVRTFGEVGIATLEGKRAWSIRAEPHVIMRMKRVFSKCKFQRGKLLLTATEEHSRELEWFMQRFPLQTETPIFEELTRSARAFDERAQKVRDILSGAYQLPAVKMALPPREYQRQAAAVTLANSGLLLADELGLGKTVSAIAVLASEGALPAIVVTPAHLPGQWKLELERFLPGIKVHIAKKREPYALDTTLFGWPDVVIMSYSKLDGWAHHLAGKFRSVVFDEVQELRHSGTNKYIAAQTISDSCAFRLGLSATPIYNYGDEFYSVCNVLRPDALGTHGEFQTEWCVKVGDGKYKVADSRAFGTYLRESGLMLRRTRADVGRELPALNRVIHEIENTGTALHEVESSALKLARLIVGTGARGIDVMQASSEFSMRLRHATGVDKAPYVAQFARMLLEQPDAEGNRDPIVLFGWHRDVYNIWLEALKEFKPELYTGSESPGQKAQSARRFIEGETDLLIVSLRSGSGLDGLQKRCSRVVIGELDWSPGALEQCIGRVFRDGQTKPVMVYYLTAQDGCDPSMIDVLGLKREQIENVRDPGGAATVVREVEPDHVRRLAEDYLKRRRSHLGMASAEE